MIRLFQPCMVVGVVNPSPRMPQVAQVYNCRPAKGPTYRVHCVRATPTGLQSPSCRKSKRALILQVFCSVSQLWEQTGQVRRGLNSPQFFGSHVQTAPVQYTYPPTHAYPLSLDWASLRTAMLQPGGGSGEGLLLFQTV